MLVRMYSIAIAEAGASNQLWAVFQAGSELRAAAAALDDAGGSLRTLSTDTQWHSDGVRALHQKLDEFAARTSTESVEARDRALEVEGVGGS